MKRLGIPWEPTVQELAASIFCREFVPAYEPVVHLATGAVLGWEVHGRWIHASRGMLTPAEYATRAEQIGLLDAVDEIVVDRALRRLRRWSGGRFESSDPWIAITVPAGRLPDGAVLEWLRPLVGHYSIPPSHVVLEISQLSPVTHRSKDFDTLTCWRDLGGLVAIDADALSGHAFDRQGGPVDLVKLNPARVEAITDQGRGESSAAAVIERAVRAGAIVIAEGVETDEQRRVLTGLGCDAAQGPLIGDQDPELTQPALAVYVG